MDSARDSLVGRLGDPDGTVRLEAALSCYDLRDPSLYEPIAARAAVEADPRVLATLIRAAALVGGERARDLVVGALRHHDPRVRANAVESLGSTHGDGGSSHLERMIHDPHHRVRGAALLGLSRVDVVRFRGELLLLARSTRPEECLTALHVLGRVDEGWAVKLLAEMVLRPDNPVRGQTEALLEGRAAWGAPGAREALAAARGAEELLPSSLCVTIHLPPKVTKASVGRFLEDASPELRIVAVQEGAQRLPKAVMVPLLLGRLAREDDPRVRATLTKWVGLCGGDAVVEALVPFLADADARVRANTLEGLSAASLPRVADEARRLLHDEAPRVRAQAATLLARREGREGLWGALELLAAGDGPGAAAALAGIPPPDERGLVEVLDMALLTGGAELRAALGTLLSDLAKQTPLAASLRTTLQGDGYLAEEGGLVRDLLGRLGSPDDQVRLRALEGLRHCRSPQAWDRVARVARTDRSPAIRERAAEFSADFERERGTLVVLYGAGLRVLHLYEAGALRSSELFGLCERVMVVERLLEEGTGGDPTERLVVQRKDLVVSLGRRGLDLQGQGALDDPVLAAALSRLDAVVTHIGGGE